MTHRQILESMTGLLAALFTALLSSTIVSVALPTIIGELQGSQRQYTWVITAALLATTVTTPIWGKLADLFSKKLLVQVSIVIFVIGSIGAGFSPNVPFLLACRVVQGLGMGGLTALVQAIMGTIIAPRQRGRYAGLMGAVMAVSTVSGPLLGGVIVDSPLGWRWTFFVCIPLAVISLIVLQFTLHVHSEPRRPRIDYLGALLLSGAASLPLLWVTFAGDDFGWWSWPTAAFLGGTALLVVLAVVWELRAPEPLVPLRVLSNRTAVLVILASVAVGIGMFGAATFLGQYFQVARGYTPTSAGLLTIPLMAAMLVSSTVAGQIISRTGRWKNFLVGGATLMLAGLVGLGTIDHSTPIWHLGIFMALMGLGMGAMMQNLVLAVQNTVDVRDIGATSATVAFFRSLGGAVGVSVLGAVLANQVQSTINDGLQRLGVAGGSGGDAHSLDLHALPAPIVDLIRAAYGDATGTIFWIGAGAAVVALVAVLFIREVPLRTTVGLEQGSSAAPEERDAMVLGGGEVPTAPDLEPELAGPVEVGDLDDPSRRQALAALDVLAAAQQQARLFGERARTGHQQVAERLDAADREVDAAVAHFHDELAAIRRRLLDDGADAAAVRGPDGTGGDQLRAYEYELLLDAQRTADKVTQLARQEAERVLTTADVQVAELEKRIATLRKAEAELSLRVSDALQHRGR